MVVYGIPHTPHEGPFVPEALKIHKPTCAEI